MRLITIKQLLLEVNMHIQTYLDEPACHSHRGAARLFLFYPCRQRACGALRREYSGRFHSLNGRWRFGFFENVRALTAPLWEDIGLMDGYGYIDLPRPGK